FVLFTGQYATSWQSKRLHRPSLPTRRSSDLVRGAGDRSIASIDASVWVPLDTLADDAADPTGVLGRAAATGPLVVYCKSGVRSARAASTLLGSGFDGVRSLEGGIEAWTRDVDPSLP